MGGYGEELEVFPDQSMLYGEAYAYRTRATLDMARIYGRGDTIYRDLLVSPYRPDFELDLPKDVDEVFPADYIRTYDVIKGAPAPPLPREDCCSEPRGTVATRETP